MRWPQNVYISFVGILMQIFPIFHNLSSYIVGGTSALFSTLFQILNSDQFSKSILKHRSQGQILSAYSVGLFSRLNQSSALFQIHFKHKIKFLIQSAYSLSDSLSDSFSSAMTCNFFVFRFLMSSFLINSHFKFVSLCLNSSAMSSNIK